MNIFPVISIINFSPKNPPNFSLLYVLDIKIIVIKSQEFCEQFAKYCLPLLSHSYPSISRSSFASNALWKSFLLFLFGRSSFDCGRVAIFLCFIFNHRRLALLESRIYSILRAVNFNIWEVTADMIIYYPIYEFSQQGNFISLHLMLLLRGESSFWQFHSCYNFHIG